MLVQLGSDNHLVALSNQFITLAINHPALCPHMASLGYGLLMLSNKFITLGIIDLDLLYHRYPYCITRLQYVDTDP